MVLVHEKAELANPPTEGGFAIISCLMEKYWGPCHAAATKKEKRKIVSHCTGSAIRLLKLVNLLVVLDILGVNMIHLTPAQRELHWRLWKGSFTATAVESITPIRRMHTAYPAQTAYRCLSAFDASPSPRAYPSYWIGLFVPDSWEMSWAWFHVSSWPVEQGLSGKMEIWWTY